MVMTENMQAGPGAGASVRQAPRRLSILGATGSIGVNTLDVVSSEPGSFEIEALTAGRNARELAELAIRFSARIAVVADPGRIRSFAIILPAPALKRRRVPMRWLWLPLVRPISSCRQSLASLAWRPALPRLELLGSSRSPIRKPWFPPVRCFWPRQSERYAHPAGRQRAQCNLPGFRSR